jgi:ribosomal protein S27AE
MYVEMQNASYFVGLGTLALINAGLAQAKGRSGLVWWLISVFLGPIATFLIVVLPKVKDRRALDTNTRECPNCGRENSIHTRICPRCDAKLDAGAKL